MKYVFGVLLLILIVLFETSVLPFFPVFGTQPNLLLVILLALQFLGFSQESYYAAFFGGILSDLLAGNLFGLGSLTLLLLSGAVGLVRRFASASPLILLLITAATSVAFRIVRVLPFFNLTVFLKGGLLDAGLMLLIYPTLQHLLKSVLGRRELKVGI